MGNSCIRNLKGSIENINLTKYGKAPTWEQIEDFLKEVGMSAYQFERFYGIAFNHLSTVKCHARNGHKYNYSSSQVLATKYWHIFYERIKPAYGVGFISDYTEEIINGEVHKKEPERKNKLPETNKNIVSVDIHHRLAELM